MPSTVSYSGPSCASGVIVPFSGVSLALNQPYSIEFSCISRMPESTFALKPTGFVFVPSERQSTLTTVFSAVNAFTIDNSSSNIIKLSVYNNQGTEIYRDYAAVYCGNLSDDPIQVDPTPTPTPTNTVTPTTTPTPTPTPTPSTTPPLPFSASFENLITSFDQGGQVVIRGVANGVLNTNYIYTFESGGAEEVGIGNQQGVVTITEKPTYVYTTILLQRECTNYPIKFGLSDGTTTVQSIGFFRFGQCDN